MITVEQIKAARALLDWNQDELAARTGVSKPTLTNIERRLSSPRQETLHAIQKALEEAGIEFTEGPGVRLTSDKINIQVFKGKDSVERLWNDIYTTLDAGEERLISGIDERVFDKNLQDRFYKMMEKYKKKGISGRILCLEGDDNFLDTSSQYRWVKPEVFTESPQYVYGNKFAMLIWEPEQKVVLIENKAIADSYRRQFEKQWKVAKPPKESSYFVY